jgi:hypothetical protein
VTAADNQTLPALQPKTPTGGILTMLLLLLLLPEPFK